jgi:hypothetical protein
MVAARYITVEGCGFNQIVQVLDLPKKVSSFTDVLRALPLEYTNGSASKPIERRSRANPSANP